MNGSIDNAKKPEKGKKPEINGGNEDLTIPSYGKN